MRKLSHHYQFDHSQEIKLRIEKASGQHPLKWPVLLYAAETWNLTEANSKRLEAFEMWMYSRILKITCMQHVTNAGVLDIMGMDQETLTIGGNWNISVMS